MMGPVQRGFTRGFLRILLVALPLGGCATAIPRTPYTLADLAVARPIDGPRVRMWARGDDARYEQVRNEVVAQRAIAGLPPLSTLLAISGGSDRGAFSAGLLNAWTRRGDRPQFDIVTGVSTGALIAPFAFLGPDQDAILKQIYTNISPKDVFRKRGIAGAIRKAGLADTTPLRTLIARYVTPAFLDRIAAEHRRGRRLFVVTTNLDAQRGVVWDMGAIALSASPDRVALFNRVLLASASIPGVFSPTLIDVTANGRHFSEMHVDGGAVGGFFILPRAILARPDAAALTSNVRMFVFYNGRLMPEFKVVRGRIISVTGASLTTLVGEIDRNSVDELQSFTRTVKARLSVCSIEDHLPDEERPLFDTRRMRAMYAFGERQVAGAAPCIR
ncbi:patatin-like phospholipase family protein [Sphingomonas sp. M1A8_2b]